MSICEHLKHLRRFEFIESYKRGWTDGQNGWVVKVRYNPYRAPLVLFKETQVQGSRFLRCLYILFWNVDL